MMYGYIVAEMERYIVYSMLIAALVGVSIAALTFALCWVLL